MKPTDTSPMCTKIAARFIGLGHRTLEQWRHLGKGPAYLKVGRQVRYRQADLDVWLNDRRIQPVEQVLQ